MRQILLILSFLCSAFCATSLFAADAAPADFAITTNAFLDTGALPVLYTCDGKDVSPQLTWSNVPPKTKSFALLLEDQDGPSKPFYHWVLFNIPAKTTQLDEGVSKLPAGTLVGKNSMGKKQYSGPCPPKGAAHTYVFTLYALDTTLNLPAGSDGQTVISSLKDHVIKSLTLSTVYSRWLV